MPLRRNARPPISWSSDKTIHSEDFLRPKREKKRNEEISDENGTHMPSEIGMKSVSGSRGSRDGKISHGARTHGLCRTRLTKDENARVSSNLESAENKGTYQEISKIDESYEDGKFQLVRVCDVASGPTRGTRADKHKKTLDCRAMDQVDDNEVRDEDHHKEHDVYHDARGHENHHAKCEAGGVKDRVSSEINMSTDNQETSEWQFQCGLCNEKVQRGCIALGMHYKPRQPRVTSDNGTDELKGNLMSGPTIVRNNHDGTTRVVNDHDGTTHVDCETNTKETTGLLMSAEGTGEDYPWFSKQNIKKWIEIELEKPRRSWSIDNYDGAESFREMKKEPTPRDQAGEDMSPEKFKALRGQLLGVERELDELTSREDLTEESRERQWKHWKTVAMELCDEFSEDEDDETRDEEAESHRCGQTTWRHRDQPYYVAQWSTTEATREAKSRPQGKHDSTNGMLNCFLRGTKPEANKRKLAILEDEESDEEEEQLVCSMTGQTWESLPFPIIIDSGACASVMPSGWCRHVPTQKTKQSEDGEYFRAANGSKIYNKGQKSVSMMTREGIWRCMRFTVCDVSKALGSVSQMCRAGHIVVFNPPWHEDGSYVQHLDTGENMWLEETNGLYVLNAKVAPKEWQTTLN